MWAATVLVVGGLGLILLLAWASRKAGRDAAEKAHLKEIMDDAKEAKAIKERLLNDPAYRDWVERRSMRDRDE